MGHTFSIHLANFGTMIRQKAVCAPFDSAAYFTHSHRPRTLLKASTQLKVLEFYKVIP